MHMDDDALAYIAITRLQNYYADAVSRRSWEELDDIFLPDANIHLDLITSGLDFTGPREIGSFIAGSIEKYEFFQFVILNVVVNVSDATNATGRMWMSELRQEAAGGGWSTIYGVYHDTYTKTDAGWRIAKRDYQSLAREGRFDVFPFPSTHAGPVG
jgi:hypothetical protein